MVHYLLHSIMKAMLFYMKTEKVMIIDGTCAYHEGHFVVDLKLEPLL